MLSNWNKGILAYPFQNEKKRKLAQSLILQNQLAFKKKKKKCHLSHRARRNFISKANTFENKKKKNGNEKKKSYKIPKDGIMKDSTTVDYRANRKIGGKKKKKGGKLSRENRLNVGFWRVEIVWNVCSVKIDVDAALSSLPRLSSSSSPLLLNQRLTYGRLVSPLNYIRIRFAIRD